MEHIANELRSYFSDRGITQQSIANELHVSNAYINAIFTGKKSIGKSTARHTWATIAHEIGVAKETISRALGHSTSTVTDIYINYNNRNVDESNRKVIGFINNL